MKSFSFVIAGLFALGAPATGRAQPIAERTDGMYRVCSYATPQAPLSGSTGSLASNPAGVDAMSGNPPITGASERRVGLGQNCPATPAPLNPTTPAPPTAQLIADRLGAGQANASARLCTYQQSGAQWTVQIEPPSSCPLYAGMIARQDDRTATLLLQAPAQQPDDAPRRRDE